MHGPAAGETLQLLLARYQVSHGREAARTVGSRAPPPRHVLDIGIEDIAPPVETQRNGIGCSPLVEGVGVKEADQHVELAPCAGERSRSAQGILERPSRYLFCIVGGQGVGRDKAAYLPDSAARVRRAAIAEVLPNAPGSGRGRAVV